MKTFKNDHFCFPLLSALLMTACTHDIKMPSEFSDFQPLVAKDQLRLLDAQSTTLFNGLRVIVMEDHFVPKVQLYVLYNVGAADDPVDLLGLSHMMEHMYCEHPVKDPKFSTALSISRASTNWEATIYEMTFKKSLLDKAFEAAADAMKNFNPTDEARFRKEVKVVSEERRLFIETPPLGTAKEFVEASLYPRHPYAHDMHGVWSTISAYTLEAVKKHYRTWYKPNNATLIIRGDVSAKDVFAKAQQYFGSIPRGAVPEHVRPELLNRHVHHRITYTTNKISAPEIHLVFDAPHHSRGEDEVAFQIGAMALFSSLERSMKREGLENVSFSSETTRVPYPWTVILTLKPGVCVEDFLKKLQQRLDQILKTGIPRYSFEGTKRRVLRDTLYVSELRPDYFRIFLTRLAKGYTLEDLETMPQRIAATTYDQSLAVTRKFLTRPPYAVTVYTPEDDYG